MNDYTDYFGNPIELGDEVVYSCLESANFRLGMVVNFGPKHVTIEVDSNMLDGTVIKRKISKRPDRLIIKPWIALL